MFNIASEITESLFRRGEEIGVAVHGKQPVEAARIGGWAVGLASVLRERGLLPADRVLIQVPNGPELAASTLAIILAGGVAVLCEPGLGKNLYLSRAKIADTKFVLIHPLVRLLQRVPGSSQLVSKLGSELPAKPKWAADVIVSSKRLDAMSGKNGEVANLTKVQHEWPNGDAEAAIVFTGGTTSAPKGVVHSHAGMEHFLGNIDALIETLEVHNYLAETPAQVMYALRSGKPAHVAVGRGAKKLGAVKGLMQSGAVDTYFGSPYLWKALLDSFAHESQGFHPQLRNVLLGAAPVTPAFLKGLRDKLPDGANILCLYGLTEAGPVCSATAEEKIAWRGEGDFIGGALPGMAVSIRKESQGRQGDGRQGDGRQGDGVRVRGVGEGDGAQDSSEGTIQKNNENNMLPVEGEGSGDGDGEELLGEVLVSGPSLYTKYLGQNKRSLEEPLSTGDMGKVHVIVGSDGRQKKVFELIGRKKDMIIRRGVNIYPGTLEPSLREMGDEQRKFFDECVLVGVWNPDLQDEEVVLCAKPGNSGRLPPMEKIKEQASQVTGPDGAPDKVLLFDALPHKGRQSKIDRRALREEVKNRAGMGFEPGFGGREGERPKPNRKQEHRDGAKEHRDGAKVRGDKTGDGETYKKGDGETYITNESAPASRVFTKSQTTEGDPVRFEKIVLPGTRVPFDWQAFFRKNALMWKREPSKKKVRVVGQSLFRLGLFAVGQAFWAVDEVIYPQWRESKFQGPLFILGHQRSGTTFLHRLLAGDTRNFEALTLHEMLFPAVTFQRGLQFMEERDEFPFRLIRDAFQRLQADLFSSMDDIHRLRFDEIEEDEFVLWGVYRSAMCVNDAPSTTEWSELDEMRHFHKWSKKKQKETLGYYAASLLKKVTQGSKTGDGEYKNPREYKNPIPWIVSKNPAFTHKIPELLEVFPNARFVYLVRNPVKTIASRLRLIREIWRRRMKGFGEMSPKQVETILADSQRTYLSAERDWSLIPKERKIIISYSDLLSEPRRIVERTYGMLGLPRPDRELEDRLAKLQNYPPRNSREMEQSSQRSSSSPYSLEEFGLTEERIREDLKIVFENHFFD